MLRTNLPKYYWRPFLLEKNNNKKLIMIMIMIIITTTKTIKFSNNNINFCEECEFEEAKHHTGLVIYNS
jgi:hypothetical protein